MTLSSPLLIELEITEFCNLKCQHCYNPYSDFRPANPDLFSLSQLEILLDRINQWGVFHILITGGEPFADLDSLLFVLDYCQHKNIDVSINTNGSLISQEVVDSLNPANISNILVSLCGSTREMHDSITKVAGSFEDTIQGTASMIAADLPVSVNIVVQKDNYLYIPSVAELVSELGVKVLCATPISPCSHIESNTRMMLDETDILYVWNQLLMAEEKFGLETSTINPIPLCAFPPPIDNRFSKFFKTKCGAGHVLACVSRNGDIKPCAHSSESNSNIFSDSFNNIWRNMHEWQDRIVAPKFCRNQCALYPICGGGCRTASEAHTGSLYGHDPYMSISNAKSLTSGVLNCTDFRFASTNTSILSNEACTNLGENSKVFVNSQIRFRRENEDILLYADTDNVVILNNVEADTFLAIYQTTYDASLSIPEISRNLNVDINGLSTFINHLIEKRIFLVK